MTKLRPSVAAATILIGCALMGHHSRAAAQSQTPLPAAYDVTEEPVRYRSGRDTVRAVLFLPDAPGERPGVVVIHEWWGLNSWVRENARQIAERGYVTLAIDLYRGEVATDAEAAHELMRGVPEDRASRDLQMAVEYLRSRKEVDRRRTASVGWCMGGGYSLQTALVVPDLTACVICYGRLVTEDATIAGISSSVLGIFGGEDRGISAESVEQFEKQATKLGKDVKTTVFDGAGHAFMNPNNEGGYHAEATAEAWAMIFTYLDTALADEPTEQDD